MTKNPESWVRVQFGFVDNKGSVLFLAKLGGFGSVRSFLPGSHHRIGTVCTTVMASVRADNVFAISTSLTGIPRTCTATQQYETVSQGRPDWTWLQVATPKAQNLKRRKPQNAIVKMVSAAEVTTVLRCINSINIYCLVLHYRAYA